MSRMLTWKSLFHVDNYLSRAQFNFCLHKSILCWHNYSVAVLHNVLGLLSYWFRKCKLKYGTVDLLYISVTQDNS